jgi:hypothetical protein
MDDHHFTQHAAVEDVPGYSRRGAPSFFLEGPPTKIGTPHYHATQMQRQSNAGTLLDHLILGAEIAHKFKNDVPNFRDKATLESTQFFGQLGLKADTPTRTPGDRRGAKRKERNPK